MSNLLALETSAEVCSVALFVEGRVLSFHRHAPMKHAELLLPAVSGLLDEANLALGDVEAIAFGRGPGSFTSLRIGIGVVQGLAWASGLPVVPVSSLAAVAQLAVEAGSSQATQVCVAMDARMQEVYTANFTVGDGVVRAAGKERVCSAEQVLIPADEPFIAAGNGFERFDVLSEQAARAVACRPSLWPRAETICTLALDWMKEHEPLPASAAQPSYVRNDVASKPGDSRNQSTGTLSQR